MACPIHSWGWETSIQMEHALGEAWLISLLWVCVCMWCVKKSKVCGIRNVINLLTSCWHGREQCVGSCQGGTNLHSSTQCDGSHGLTEVIMCTILGPNCFSTQFRSKISVCQHKNEIPIQFRSNIVCVKNY